MTVVAMAVVSCACVPTIAALNTLALVSFSCWGSAHMRNKIPNVLLAHQAAVDMVSHHQAAVDMVS